MFEAQLAHPRPYGPAADKDYFSLGIEQVTNLSRQRGYSLLVQAACGVGENPGANFDDNCPRPSDDISPWIILTRYIFWILAHICRPFGGRLVLKPL